MSGLSDQDTFYDESDFLEQQGMEGIIQRYMSRPGTDLDLLDQLQLYELVLRLEDGDSNNVHIPDNTVRKTPRYRPSIDTEHIHERRKSRRHSSACPPLPPVPPPPILGYNDLMSSYDQVNYEEDSSSSGEVNRSLMENGEDGTLERIGDSSQMRKRRERSERQKSLLKEQLELAAQSKLNRQQSYDELEEVEQSKCFSRHFYLTTVGYVVSILSVYCYLISTFLDIVLISTFLTICICFVL